MQSRLHFKNHFCLRILLVVFLGVLQFLADRYSALAQPLNENCTVSILNRTAQVRPDGTWDLPNVPANFGQVRARATCVENGVTRSGQSGFFTISQNRMNAIAPFQLGTVEPIPSRLTLSSSVTTLTQMGATAQLSVTATYPNGTNQSVTAQAFGTSYTTSNPNIATIGPNGLVTAVSSGVVVISAMNEGVLGLIRIQVTLSGDSDGDGIPDDQEIANGLNPNDPIDALEDLDGDGLNNQQEVALGTDPRNADTDGDGLQDGDEVTRTTNPLIADSDGDGLRDGLEVQTGSNPLDPNSYNLAQALSSIVVTPDMFTLILNTIIGEAARQLTVTGHLIDGTEINLTSTTRGTSYISSDLFICSFGVQDGRVFAGSDGLCTVTVTNSGHSDVASVTVQTFAPTALSTIDIPGYANNVDVRGSYAYIAAGSSGLQVVDVSNPTVPVIVGSVDTPGNANDVKVVGSTVFIADGLQGLQVIDVTMPNNPVLIGSVDTPGEALDVFVSGTYTYVADGASGLQIIDISTLSSPSILGSVATSGPASGVAVNGNLAVIAAGNFGIQIVDVADPQNPAIISGLVYGGDARDVVINNNHAFVADYSRSLTSIDISNPQVPTRVASTPAFTGGILQDVAVFGRFAAGADVSFASLGVPVIDILDAANPIPRVILDFGVEAGGTGIAMDSSYVYLTASPTYDDAGVLGNTALYIGQYQRLEDTAGIPPTVQIVSPAHGTTAVERSTITVIIDAFDDVQVAAVDLLVNGNVVGTGISQFRVVVPTGVATLTLTGRATDVGGNVAVSPAVTINVIPDTVPPVVTLTSPASGASFIEGELVQVTASATDNVRVVSVDFLRDGQIISTDTTAPYRYSFRIPIGVSNLTLSATAVDSAGNIGYSNNVQLNVSADPGTTVQGRVVDKQGNPVVGAAVRTIDGRSSVSGSDGTFTISDVSTVLGNITVSAEATVGGVPLVGTSAIVSPVRGGVTGVGNIILINVRSIAAGGEHTCALLSDGTVQCWGANYSGQLGNGTFSDSNDPILVSGVSTGVVLATGAYNTCVVLANGSVQCWGDNSFGQLGNGSVADTDPYGSPVPVTVSGISSAVAVAIGQNHSCALLAGGTVQCWGYNFDGELGDGTFNDSPLPVSVSNLSGVISISSGSFHTCALLIDGGVRCWGYNGIGGLGIGAPGDSASTPQVVQGISTAIQVSAAEDYTCALLADGTVQCWGANFSGQLGTGTYDDWLPAVPVSGITNAVSISAGGIGSGDGFTCARLVDGTVRCWGYNGDGQLGNGTLDDSSIPVTVTDISNALTVSTGGAHTCALLADGGLRCWGANYIGQLGIGNLSYSPVPLIVGGITTAAATATGNSYSCVRLYDGTAQCWGTNWAGQLGNGIITTDFPNSMPNPGVVTGLTGVASLSAGSDHACALLTGGAIKCWGYNASGELGDGTIIDSGTPVLVSGISNAIEVSSGISHTCALIAGGTVQCWGGNFYGQLGNDAMSEFPQTTPVTVSGISNATAISAGGYHTCALLADGTVRCWGFGYNGELGNGIALLDPPFASAVPVAVTGISTAVGISAGFNHTCALLSGGGVRCWGENSYGQIGNGQIGQPVLTPDVTAGVLTAVTISAGGYHTCVLLSDGSARCWGANYTGQIGNGTVVDFPSAVVTPEIVIGISGVASISGGADHTCAALTNGTVWCWGSNNNEQLGRPNRGFSSIPVPVVGF